MQKLAKQLHVTVAQRAPPEFLKPLHPVLEVEPGQTARYALLQSFTDLLSLGMSSSQF